MTTTSQAIAQREEPTARALVTQYQQDFAAVLPSHVKVESWVRIAQGALKTGARVDNRPNSPFKLEVAAQNNPAAFLGALRTAARLGLTPGSDEFYLSTRKNQGRDEVEGTVGYQGYIELMYRAGAVESVIVETVRQNDVFRFAPGRDAIPEHEIDWDLSDDERGSLRLVYAFARMKGGATSKVVVLNRDKIKALRAKSMSASSQYSPWNTNEEAMWLKSAARQLRKWVPTSAEYITAQLRAAKEADKPVADIPVPITVHIPDEYDSEVVEGEIVA